MAVRLQTWPSLLPPRGAADAAEGGAACVAPAASRSCDARLSRRGRGEPARQHSVLNLCRGRPAQGAEKLAVDARRRFSGRALAQRRRAAARRRRRRRLHGQRREARPPLRRAARCMLSVEQRASAPPPAPAVAASSPSLLCESHEPSGIGSARSCSYKAPADRLRLRVVRPPSTKPSRLSDACSLRTPTPSSPPTELDAVSYRAAVAAPVYDALGATARYPARVARRTGQARSAAAPSIEPLGDGGAEIGGAAVRAEQSRYFERVHRPAWPARPMLYAEVIAYNWWVEARLAQGSGRCSAGGEGDAGGLPPALFTSLSDLVCRTCARYVAGSASCSAARGGPQLTRRGAHGGCQVRQDVVDKLRVCWWTRAGSP